MKTKLILLLVFAQISSYAQKTDVIISEANIFMQLPNSEWNLASKTEGEFARYIFKRTAIEDSEGREIVAAIMVFVEDASEYNQDVTNYSIVKRMQFQGKGIIVDKILVHEDEEYPLSYKNAYITMCSYADNGLEHILYMIHIIDKNNKGIQIYLDMTKDLVEKYEKEFWTTIKSIKEI